MNKNINQLKINTYKKDDNLSLKILVIEDNPADVYLINNYLKTSGIRYTLKHCSKLADALELLNFDDDYDVILLDLGLPDSQGLDTLKKLQNIKNIPSIIVLTVLDDEKTALSSLKEGGQDFIVKDKLNSENIIQSIKYGFERKRCQD